MTSLASMKLNASVVQTLPDGTKRQGVISAIDRDQYQVEFTDGLHPASQWFSIRDKSVDAAVPVAKSSGRAGGRF